MNRRAIDVLVDVVDAVLLFGAVVATVAAATALAVLLTAVVGR